MRTRLTKQAMGINDSPTTMHAPQPNPPVEKYETGNPDTWAETPNMTHPWDEENAAGREETGHPKMKATYANMVRNAKDLEEKAIFCLKMAEAVLPEAPEEVIEKQAVDFMNMSTKSVLATLRRLREFEANVNEARIGKIVDAVLEVIAEEEEVEEKKEEKKEEPKVAEEKVEEKKEEEKKEEPKVAEEKKEEEKEEEEEDMKIATIVTAVLKALAEEKEEKVEEKKEEPKVAEEKVEEKKEEEKKEEPKVAEEKVEEKKEEKKEEAKVAEEKVEEKKEEKKEEAKVAEEKKEEPKVEEKKEEEAKIALDISFDDAGDVMASDENAAVLSQIFATEENEVAKEEEKKEAKIQTLKNVTASKEDEISKISSLWKIN